MKKAIFLDKDGTLIQNVPYNVEPDLIQLTKGCGEGLKRLTTSGYRLIVISNQPGIAKGYFTFTELEKAEKALSERAAAFGSCLSDFYYCPHDPHGTVEQFRVSCLCRKPAPGLVLQAAREHNIDLQRSWLIGDILNDIEAGRRAGCKTVLIDNGNETEWVLSPRRLPHHIVQDLEQAADIICLLSRDSP